MIAHRERRLSVLLALLWAAGVPCLAPAQTGERLPLFIGDDAIELTLTAPVRTLVNGRMRRPEVVGTLGYEAAGAPVTLAVEVTTRGHSRLEICSFPPLSLNLRRSEVDGTLFAGQNRLKLVTLCRDANDYRQYLELEYLVYRIYEQVSEHAFSVRPVRMRYVDTDRKDRLSEAPAFFIEHIDGLAARVGMEAAEVPAIERAALEPRSLAILGLFQFMIGNTDWSVTSAAEGEDCCHNTDVLMSPDGQYVVVPYDFDQAGFINAAYAAPSERLRIRSVRQRLYRGLCTANEYTDSAIATFNAARPAIEALLAAAGLDDRFRRDAASYVAEFYAIINDPEQLRTEILDSCRGTA